MNAMLIQKMQLISDFLSLTFIPHSCYSQILPHPNHYCLLLSRIARFNQVSRGADEMRVLRFSGGGELNAALRQARIMLPNFADALLLTFFALVPEWYLHCWEWNRLYTATLVYVQIYNNCFYLVWFHLYLENKWGNNICCCGSRNYLIGCTKIMKVGPKNYVGLANNLWKLSKLF